MTNNVWEINGLSLELDLEDYESNLRYRRAFDEMAKEEKNLCDVSLEAEIIKGYCLLFYKLYDSLFGDGIGEKIFKGKYNSRTCDDVYANFLDFVKVQVESTKKRRMALRSDSGISLDE